MDWIKCSACGRVVEAEDTSHECRPKRKRAPGSSRESVAAHRERTGNAYGKAYAKAKADAVRELCARYPDEFAQLLEKARVDAGLGPTRGR